MIVTEPKGGADPAPNGRGTARHRHRLNGYLAQRVPSLFLCKQFYDVFKLRSSKTRYVSLED